MFRTLIVIVAALVLAACSREPRAGQPDGPLVIGASAVPHAEVLAYVEPMLRARGVQLEVRVFDDYLQPNLALADGRLDANYFQTAPYLEQANRNYGFDLVAITAVHVEPLGAYSLAYDDLEDLPEGARVAIPNETTNSGRALMLLQRAGLIRLKDPDNALSTLEDVVDNPRRLDIRDMEAEILPRILNQVDLAVINTNYALDAGLSPRRDALIIESGASPWANLLVTRADNRDDPRVAVLASVLRGPDARAFIEREYGGAVIPAG